MEGESTNFYSPSREDTKQEFEKLRSIVEHRLGAFRSIVIQGVADIVLWILKCEDCFNTPMDKRGEVEKLLNPVADQMFEQMLLIAEHITDYPAQESDYNCSISSHPYSVRFHNDEPITTMEDIVAYNLLIRVYQDAFSSRPQSQIIHQTKACEMLLILKHQSLKPIDAQGGIIGNLLDGLLGQIYCDLLVFIISKLFPDFLCLWDDVAFNVIQANICVDSPPALEGEVEGDRKVIDTLLIFTWGVVNSARFWEDEDGDEGVDIEDSGGFEESENELMRRSEASFSHDLHQQLFLSRKGNVNRSGAKDHVRMREGERLSSLFQLGKSIFRSEF